MLMINHKDMARLVKATMREVQLDADEVIVQTWLDELHTLANEVHDKDGDVDRMAGMSAQFVRAFGVLTAVTPYATYGPNSDERVDMTGSVIELVVDYYNVHQLTMASFINMLENDKDLEEEPFVLFD